MGYESAKSTRLLATHCLCCRRPLRDAVSVEIGIGPVCREKYGYNAPVDDAARSTANKLIHEAAAVMDTNTARVLEIAEEIRDLGLEKLAETVLDRFVPIRLTDKFTDWDNNGEPKILVIEAYTPYSPTFVATLKQHTNFRRRRAVRNSNGKFSHWEVWATKAERLGLFRALIAAYPGEYAVGAKGVFQVPTHYRAA
tara:strand:- start:1957 stop:2547 length:591 start_codon:yes stop_codon:yes gene_type:complete